MNAPDDPGKLIDEARRLRRYSSSATSLISVLRVASHEVAIERRKGILGWLTPSRGKPEEKWESIPGLDSAVLQDALFIVRDKYEAQARKIESRLTVKDAD